MFLGAVLLALLPLGASAAPSRSDAAALLRDGGANLRQGPCPDSFPLAEINDHGWSDSDGGRNLAGGRRMVAIPPSRGNGEWYETGEYYAPLCPDGERVDVRRLFQCIGGSCWDDSVNQCTFVCTWNAPSPKPTPQPTQKPSFPPEETEHPILLDLRSLPELYRMNKEVRAAILRYLRDRLEYDLDELDIGLKLVEVTNPGRLPGLPHKLPLNIKVVGPSDLSDFALSYILQMMRDSTDDIVSNLKKLNGGADYAEAFKDVTLSIQTYDANDIATGDTVAPSKSPTFEPVVAEVKPKSIPAVILEEPTTIPWWVWLIVALVVVTCCLCCVCGYCWRRRRGGDGDKGLKQEVNLFVGQNPLPGRRRASENKETAKTSERVPRSVVARRNSFTSRRSERTRRTKRDGDDRTTRTKRDSDDRTTRTKRSTRTQQTRRTHKTRSAGTFAPPPPVQDVIAEEDSVMVREEEHSMAIVPAVPVQTAETFNASSLSCDPPEEQTNVSNVALTVWNPNSRADASEPEGDKIDRKTSMIGSAALMGEVHREISEREQREAAKRRSSRRAPRGSFGEQLRTSFKKWKSTDPNSVDKAYHHHDVSDQFERSEPEGVTADEAEAERGARRKSKKKSSHKKKKGSSSRPRRASRAMESIRSSFNWNAREAPIDIASLGPDDSVVDSPSIATNHPPDAQDTAVRHNDSTWRRSSGVESDDSFHAEE